MAQKSLTPVTWETHRHQYWRRFTSFQFARHVSECPVVLEEILQVAAAFPIAFRVASDGVQAVARLSMLGNAPTPFISAEGAWLARYLPLALRCPPFHIGKVADQPMIEGHTLQLMVDETLGLVTNESRDERFFDASGDLTPEVSNVRSFLQKRAKAEQEIQALCVIIQEMKLLSPLDQHVSGDCPEDLLGVSLQAVETLPQSHRTLLTNSGALRLIHAHQVSLSHAAWITEAQRRLAERVAGFDSSNVSGFLDAIVSAQDIEQTHGLSHSEDVHAHM